MLIKEIHSQDSYFKLSAINSGETSLNLSTELANYISPALTPGSSAAVRFLLYKSDFLEAVSYISKKLPLYTSTSRSATQVDLSLDFFDTYIKEISSLFGINDVAHYDVSLLYRNDGRIYLNNLNFNGFNLRHFLVEENSILQFDRVGSDIVIRLRSGQLNCIIREKHANNFGVAVCHYLWGVDRFTNFQPYFKISDPTTNYTVVSYNGKTLFRFLNPNLADSTNTKRWDNNPIDVGGVDYILCREWTEAENNSNVPSIAVLDYLIKELYDGKYSIVKENGYFILKETCHQSLTVLDTNQLHGPLQKIVYGAPGTGKSHGTDGEIKKVYPTKKDERGYVFRTTFHPDSDYSTFVGCYKPTMGKPQPIYGFDSVGHTVKAEDAVGKDVMKQDITYRFIPQSFTKAYIAAWKTLLKGEKKPVFLVIEEINRGNCAQIFGDLFQLLDRNKAGFSTYPIKPDTDLGNFIKEELNGLTSDKYDSVVQGEELILPNNLYIWATMNTSDQSLFPIDSAFKRRWDWKYVPINTEAKSGWKIMVDGQPYSWSSFLDKINTEIEDTTSSEDKQLGFFFCKADDTDEDGNDGVITAEKFVSKVLFYLYNDVFKDYGFEREFFKDKDNNSKIITFRSFYKMDGSINEKRVSVLLKNLEVDKYTQSNDDEEDEDGNVISSTTSGRDYTKYSINGEGRYGKNNLAAECVKKYIELNPDKTADEVLNNWLSLGNIVPHFIESKEQFDARTDNSKRSHEIVCGDKALYVAHNGYGSNGKANVLKDAVNQKNWGIIVEEA